MGETGDSSSDADGDAAASDDAAVVETNMRDLISSSLSNIRNTLLEGLTSLHYEHYVRRADIQRSKDIMAKVMAEQRRAITQVLQDAEITDAASLEPYINKIMDAVGPMRSRQAEDKARQ